MDHLLAELSASDNWKDLLRASCKKNKLCTSLAGQLTPSKLTLLRERFKKAYDLSHQTFFESWIEHQMRAFNWILIALSALKNVRIEDFGPSEWESLYHIFSKKSPGFIRYETRRFLLEKTLKNKNWAPDQNEVLKEIVVKYDSEKIIWNQVARKLFEESGEKYFRSAKHCREHWLNYLDDSKNRGQWSSEQDVQLLKKVQEEGKKWAKIGSLLNRTEHSVKNRFNSILSKQKKLTPLIRKEEKMIEEIIKGLEPNIPTEIAESPKCKLRIKSPSGDSIFGQNMSYNRDPCFNFQEIEPKNSLDFLHPYSIEGGEFVRHLLKDDQGANNRSQGSCLPSFWMNSPKSVTPFGLSPSPLSLNYGNLSMNYSYYMQNFNMSLKKQQSQREEARN